MNRKMNDIKAPDGYTLGGPRLVRKDGTILFGRGWWQFDPTWAGEMVWVHEMWKGNEIFLEVAAPGLHIYEARTMCPPHTTVCERTARVDAAPVYRRADRKAWAQRSAA